MFLVNGVDKGKERRKRLETEPQKRLSDRGDPDVHSSRAALDPS